MIPAETPINLGELEEVFAYFSSSILRQKTKEDIAWDLAKNCIGRLHFEDCVIYFVDHDRKVLVQTAAYGPKNPVDRELIESIEIPLGMGVTGFVASSGQSKIVPNTLEEPLYIKDDQLRLSEIAVPIQFNDEVIGVIDCEHSSEAFFTEEHLKILEALAAISAIKMARLSD